MLAVEFGNSCLPKIQWMDKYIIFVINNSHFIPYGGKLTKCVCIGYKKNKDASADGEKEDTTLYK